MIAVIPEEGMKTSVDDDEIRFGESIGEVDLEAYVREVSHQYELVYETCSYQALICPWFYQIHQPQ